MSALQVSATFAIHDGKLDEFKRVMNACIECVREKDTKTLQYDWFLSQDGTTCEVRERYDGSDGLLEHIGNVGELLGQLLGVSDISVELYGEPSQELLDATAAFPTKVYGAIGSM